ncbi:MAG: hypothetical protein QOE52_5820, partial [Mycobacterium sp.]|nr:hypothetical protein [Mycobacterium sp.]
TKNGINAIQSENAWSGNERDICNYGKGGSSDLQPTA